MVRCGAWTARSGAGHAYAFEQGLCHDAVVSLAGGEHESQRTALPVGGEVDLGGQASSGSTEGVIVRFVLPVLPPFRPVAAAC